MGWAEIIGLILNYGIPVAERIFQKASSGAPPSQADFDELKVLASQTAQSQMLAAAARAGLPPDDPRVKALLELMKPPFLPPITPATPPPGS